MSRPLIQRSTEELFGLFEEWRHDRENLEVLLAELQYRDRPRAKKLRDEVKRALSGVPTAKSQSSATQADLPLPSSSEEQETRLPKSKSRRKNEESPRSPEAHHPPYTDFTLIQPQGVSGRPQPYRPELLNDVRLDVSRDDAMAKRYRVALAELIREMKRRKIGHRQFVLEDGERMMTEAHGFSYQFEFTEDANLFEGAQVELIIGGQSVNGSLTGIVQGHIIVTVSEDFGSTIGQCILRVDNTALIQALHDRLQKIENGEVTTFRADFAASVINNEGDAQPPAPLPKRFCGELNDEKQQFIRVALSNEVSWLWGPPGTGKTKSLTVLTRLLYDAGKRILICSNTNQAVDQVLLQLCRDLQKAGDTALDEGRIVRLGRVEHDALRNEFEGFITVEGIVARRSEGLQRRKSEIEVELLRLGVQIADVEDKLRRFLELDGAQKALVAARNELGLSESACKEQETALQRAMVKLMEVQSELGKWCDATKLRRVFLRKEEDIRRDLAACEAAVAKNDAAARGLRDEANARRSRVMEAEADLSVAERAVVGLSRTVLQRRVTECDERRQPLRDELARIAAELEHIRERVLQEARIVGATVTRTYLRPTEFSAFDTVVIDEASMILLPAVFHAAGLATERVVVAGDFRQLPPIVQTEQKAIHDVLSHDVFQTAGIADRADRGTPPRFAKLMTQFRMHEELCRPISAAFYGGRLQTGRSFPDLDLPEPFRSRLTIVDTSRVWPFTTRNLFQSRFNLMHALAIRNIVLHFRDSARIVDSEGRGMVGLCTPYSAQAKLLREILKTHGLEKTVRASTAHGFQGDERSVLILDLVDSIGERNAGVFLQANRLEDAGAKLQNVALSRAKEAIIVVANLTFLDAKLPGDATLRGLLYDLQRTGQVVDVRDVLALRPVIEDLRHFEPLPEIDSEALRTGLFDGRDFARLVRLDMEQAKRSVVIFSGFITPKRTSEMGDLLRRKIAQGVRVRCVTRPPRFNGSIPEEDGRSALAALEVIGSAIDLRQEIHEKVVLIDGRIAWFGSLNPLSHTAGTSELMARVEDEALTGHLASLLSLRRHHPDSDEAEVAGAENPRCPKCGGWSVFWRKGKYGPFFRCESSDCDWSQSLDAGGHSVRPSATKRDSGISEKDALAQKCPKCGSAVKKRSGRFGDFYSCSRYPKCDGKLDSKPGKKSKGASGKKTAA